MHWFLLYILLFLMSFILTAYIRSYALKINCIDVPNERSSHIMPTPRGGGVAFVSSFFLGITIGRIFGVLSQELFVVLCIIGTGLACLGFADDKFNLSAKFRIIIQLLLSVYSVWLLCGLQHNWIFLFGVVFYLIWFINLYNFMDGIDGYVVMETLFISASSAILCHNLAIVFLCIFFATLGFGLWNFPRAKIFMGDVGSVFLGGILAVMSIYIAKHHSHLIAPWFILVALFMADATLTLILRIIKGERFWAAHRKHAYQYLTQFLESHVAMTILGLVINVCYLFPLAYFTFIGILSPYIGLTLAYIPLVVGVMWCKHTLQS